MPELRNKGLAVAVITYDSTAILADFSRRRGITFPLLSDQGSATIKSYGLLNTTVDSGVDELRHSVPRHVPRQSTGRRHRTVFRRGLSGTEYGGEHPAEAGRSRARD